jgi:hypothetical protein
VTSALHTPDAQISMDGVFDAEQTLRRVEDVLRIREAADSRKRATARKLLEEFRASVKPSGGGR